MDPLRIALANLRVPATPEESITLAQQAIDQASWRGSTNHLFSGMLRPDPDFLEPRLVRHRRSCREGEYDGCSRNGAIG